VAIAATALTSPALANTVQTNATQLTLTQAANSQTGVSQGGQFAISGSGLTLATLPVISTAGKVTVANAAGFTANQNATFSYLATARQADSLAVGTNIAAANLSTGTFSDVTSSSSTGAGTLGTLTINAAGVAATSAGAGSGSTATGIFSSKNAGRFASVENRRIVSSANTQNITNSDAQQAKFSANGAGIDAITAGGFSNSSVALGAAIVSTALAGGTCANGAGSTCALGGAFNLTQETTATQAASAMNVTSTALTTPSYGIVDYSAGGTTAGAITFTNINTVAVVGGGAGTTSSLSQVGELTAFN
jgi:hypothetical protein